MPKCLPRFSREENQPVGLGELLAGIIVGPYALGGLPLFDGGPLVVLDETVKHIGELSAILILFVAGLEITPREFLKGGAASFTVGALGVVIPFFVGFGVFSVYGLNAFETLLIATALTATSIAISIQVLTELGKMQSKEARLILGAAIVDDILAVVAIAISTKLLGCGLPSLIFLKDKTKSLRVGIGMISRGEVGLIVAGVGVTTGALSTDIYTAIIIMVALTTIITPIWLKKVYQRELPETK